jgi:peptidoglycan/xylan/chitin deacetylase (PgdA/CDA1 family)
MRRYLGEAVCAAARLAFHPAGRNPVWSGIKQGPQESRSVALTFDDGPSESTPRLLDVLEKHGVRATFFQCGSNVRRLPQIAREVARRGHEIGNHTFTHAQLYWQRVEAIHLEIASTQEAIAETCGAVPALFRAPFGSRWFGVSSVLRETGLRMVKWSHDSGDWHFDEKAIVDHATASLHGGAILLFHDARALASNPDVTQTIRAIDIIIPLLRDQDYAPTPLSVLLAPG